MMVHELGKGEKCKFTGLHESFRRSGPLESISYQQFSNQPIQPLVHQADVCLKEIKHGSSRS